jgi:two-component system chemotaxis response regulator CheY
MKALVVDDSAVACRVLWGILQHDCGFNDHVEAEDGIQAVEIAGEQEFDLILLDWNMPRLFGIDALREIRSLGIKTPVIMITSEKERERVVQAFDAGANDYIVKPFGPSLLAKKIQHVLMRARDRDNLLEAGKVLVADDSGIMRKLLVGMLKEWCRVKEVEEASDGAAALEAAIANDYGLILLDWNMPKMNGIDVVRALRDREVTTAIIMVTSETDESHVIQAFDAGADNYITKPFEPATLSLKIRQALYL